MTPQLAPPKPLTVYEIKRRTKALIEAAQSAGVEVAGVTMTHAGTIQALDKTALPIQGDDLDKFL